MEFAICQWAPDTSDKAFASLSEEGVTALEPGASFLQLDDAAIEDAAVRLRAVGIRIYSCHAPFGGKADLSHPDEAERTNAVAAHKDAIRRARAMGARCLVIHPSGPMREDERRARHKQLHVSLDTLVAEAEGAGVRLSLENMLPGYLCDEGAALRAVVDAFDSPHLGVCFDTGHAHLNRDGVLASFRAVRERVNAFHLQDNDGRADKHLQPPYGTIDWGAFRDEFRGLAFTGRASVEALPWNLGSWKLLLHEVQALFSVGLLTVPLGRRKVRVICAECGRYCFGTPESCSCGCGSS